MANIKHRRYEDFTSKIFGKLSVLSFDGTDIKNNTKWLCRCICGKQVSVVSYNLKRGKTTSCGCRQREVVTKHGHNGLKESQTHITWRDMKQRCLDHKHIHYSDYGGRGITVCKEWVNDFRNFLKDMGESPEGTTIDRINVNGNYEPGNCRWATIFEQVHNRRVIENEKSKQKAPWVFGL